VSCRVVSCRALKAAKGKHCHKRCRSATLAGLTRKNMAFSAPLPPSAKSLSAEINHPRHGLAGSAQLLAYDLISITDPLVILPPCHGRPTLAANGPLQNMVSLKEERKRAPRRCTPKDFRQTPCPALHCTRLHKTAPHP